MAVAEARGVALYLLKKHKVAVVDISPNEVKSAVTGNGSADKRSVAKMVRIILNEPDFGALDDTTDALAVALAVSRITVS